MTEKIFLTISCAELVMGLLGICNVTLPMSRFILWGFLLVYAVIVLKGYYSRSEKLLLGVLLVFGALLYINSGINTDKGTAIFICIKKCGF